MQRWPASKAFFWEQAPFFRLLLPLVCGVCCYEYNLIGRPDISIPVVLFATCTFSFIVLSFIRIRSGWLTHLRDLLLQSTFLFLGWLVCFLTDIRNDERWFGNALTNAQAFEARVLETPVEKEKTWKAKIALLRAVNGTATRASIGEALLYVYKDKAPSGLKQGDVILLPNHWSAIRNPGNPHEFDYATFCRRNGLHYQQFIAAGDVRLLERPATQLSWIDRTHQWAMTTLAIAIKDQSTLGLIQAMLLGDDINFDRDHRQLYADTGIIHIVAISGSHVMVFFALVALFFFWVRNRRYDFIKYLIALPLVCFYVAVAGAPVSAVRAAVMFSFLAFGLLLQKDRQPLNQLFATAFFMLLYEPMWIFAIGFQLSFIAVLSLILFYRPLYNRFRSDNWLLKRLWQVTSASIAAEILIAPLVIYYFHLLPVAFLLANVVAYVFMGAVLLGGLLLLALNKIAILAGALAFILTWTVSSFNNIVRFFQQLNPLSFGQLYLSFVALLVVYFIIVMMANYLVTRNARLLQCGLAGICVLQMLLLNDKWRTLHQNQFIAYNTAAPGYAELIMGDTFYPVNSLDRRDDTNRKIQSTIKEQHVASGALQKGAVLCRDILTVGKKKVLFLNEQLTLNSPPPFSADYMIIGYPVRDFDGARLQELFRFKKLVISGAQKRYLTQQWRDSCDKYRIPVHFTMLDGAFILKD